VNDEPRQSEGPAPFDKEAARARYRKLMRGPFMRAVFALLLITILLSWGLGIAAVYAKSVEQLPGHDLTVAPKTCVACHRSGAANIPPLPHPAAPSCGFCHRQSLPLR
jgi:hypothetical protein